MSSISFQVNESQVSAAAIESVAENASDGIIAPLFFYAIGGLPAAFAYRFANTAAQPASTSQTDIAVLALPRIANFDDFDSLQAESDVHIRHVDSVKKLGTPDAIIIPATKSTMTDLHWLRQTGLADAMVQFANNGGEVVGICGGYQMVEQSIHDPHPVESQSYSNESRDMFPEWARENCKYPEKAGNKISRRLGSFQTSGRVCDIYSFSSCLRIEFLL